MTKTYLKKQYNTMNVEVNEKGIALVKFNRPEARNAANIEMSHERLAIYEGLSNDPEVRVVIVTGDEEAYCAGGDLADFSTFDVNKAYEFGQRGIAYQRALMNMPKPTIAAIAGYAFGGGFENVLLCDLRIAAENAQFALPEINVGIFPGGGGTQRLVQHLTPNQAKEMIFLGKKIDAQKAQSLGLVNQVVPVDELMQAAYALAEKLLNKPLYALAQAKALINQAWGMDLETGLRYEVTAWASTYGTQDQQEGMQAFLEKRKPNYRKTMGGQ